MQLNPQIFREYDIRGYVDRDLSSEFAHLLGRAYAQLAKENNKNNIAIGFDCRLSSPSYAQALIAGINSEGLDTINTGMGPTPQLYYAVFSQQLGGGIQVTGSHNPADMNGFKICLGTNTLSGLQIQDLRNRMLALQNDSVSNKIQGKNSELNIRPKYINELIENCRPFIGKRKLKVVVDAGNGVGGLVGPAVLKGLGAEVIELFTEPDGRFPNHHPDPTEVKNIQVLIETVKKSNADFGIGWDGDADRIGAVDQNGNVIFGDMLLLIFSRRIFDLGIKPTVIGDVKCSSLLFDDVRQRGGKAIMSKTGHSLIKNKLRETNAELAGEMSGHIFFKHRYYGYDDAIYASARLLEIVSNTDKKVSELLSDLPKTFSTPEIRIDCSDSLKFKVATQAQSAFPEFKTDTTDGVRIEFNKGWGIIRASNTQPVLVMRFEAQTESLLEEYKNLVSKKIEEIIKSLS